MNVLLFGASGAIGCAIAGELVRRGHAVTGVTRTGTPLDDLPVEVIIGDAADPDSVARLAAGRDAVVSAVGPRRDPAEDAEQSLLGAARGLVAGLRRAGVRRLVVVGGAGSLEVSPGERLVDTPGFPRAWRPAALAHADALDVFAAADDLDWTYISPAAQIGPGERTGKFRVGGDQLLRDEAGHSLIAIPDFAIAVADAIESGGPARQRISVAY
ncbi:MAG: NAD(P)-dependent oxidoreductase [Streptosporangiaceae bacterium]|jgi:putative NADH-flavin reductase|nr:epimerase [Actinomycetota bacterium]